MESVFARCSASISELNKNPSSLIEQAGGEPIAMLNHNKPTVEGLEEPHVRTSKLSGFENHYNLPALLPIEDGSPGLREMKQLTV